MEYLYSKLIDFKHDTIKEFYNTLNDLDKNTYNNYKNSLRKKQFICGRILLNKLLKNYYNIEYKDVIINNNKNGKPYIRNYPIYFNISHSNNYVICVISNNEIGVDIEKIKTTNIRTISQYATNDEIKYIFSNKKNINKRAIEIYTLKESFFKMKGLNLNNIKNINFYKQNNKYLCNYKSIKIISINNINRYACTIIEKVSH